MTSPERPATYHVDHIIYVEVVLRGINASPGVYDWNLDAYEPGVCIYCEVTGQ